jgi:hypothetical protein
MFTPERKILFPVVLPPFLKEGRDFLASGKIFPACHSEEAQRPKNLVFLVAQPFQAVPKIRIA